MKLRIVIPLSNKGGKYGDDMEARFLIRSLVTHLKDEFEVTILSKELPAWIRGVEHLPYNMQGKSSLHMVASHYPEGFIWMYPVTCLLKDTDAESIKITNCTTNAKSISPFPARTKILSDYFDKAKSMGFKFWDYTTFSGPYWFDMDMILSCDEEWPDDDIKFPFESWILSKHNSPRKFRKAKFYQGNFHHFPNFNDYDTLVYNEQGNTRELRDYLSTRYPVSYRFESDEGAGTSLRFNHGLLARYELQCDRFYDEWAKNPFPIRTACEVGVGPYSFLTPFQDIASNLIMVEPCPRMSARAELLFPKAKVWSIAIWDEQTVLTMCDRQSGSYLEAVDWAPSMLGDQEEEKTYSVCTQPFPVVDDGKIDLLNLDCEGCEWKVLEQLISEPTMIQIEIMPQNPDKVKIQNWFKDRGYGEPVAVPINTFIYRK